MGTLFSIEGTTKVDCIAAVDLYNVLQDIWRVVILLDLQAATKSSSIDGAIPVDLGWKDLEKQLKRSVNSKLEGMNGVVDVNFVAYGAQNLSGYAKLGRMLPKIFYVQPSPHQQERGNKASCASFAALSSSYEEFQASYPFLCTDGSEYEEGRVYPSHMFPRVFLSNYGIASDPHTMKSLKITHVVNCTPHHPFACTNGPHATTNMRVPVTDIADEALKMASFFEPAATFIHNALQDDPDNRVLVHCKHGQSRSATIIIAFMLKYRPSTFDSKNGEYTVEGATQYLRHHRPRVSPNAAFVNQLDQFKVDIDLQASQ
jgi:hypothetical protein